MEGANGRIRAQRRSRRGVLKRVLPVKALELSPGGCLLEVHSPIQVPVVGALTVTNEHGTHSDDVRLSRCVPIEGTRPIFRAAAEFLWIRRPGRQSIRRMVQQLQDGIAP